MAKKNKKPESSETTPTAAPQSKNTKPKVHSESGGTSTSVWLILFLITAGTGGGFYYLLEEMKNANEALTVQLDQVTKELSQLSSFNSESAKMKEEISSLKSLQGTLKDFEHKQLDVVSIVENLSQQVNSVKNDLSENQKGIETIVDQQKETKQFITYTETTQRDLAARVNQLVENFDKLQTGNSQQDTAIENINKMQTETAKSVQGLEIQVGELKEKTSSEIHDFLAVVDTNIEGITNDIARLSDSSESQDKQAKQIEENAKRSEALMKQMSDKVASVEEGAQNKLDQARDYIVKLEEMVSSVQESTTKQINDLSLKVVEAKQSSENIKNSGDEIKTNVKSEVAEAATSLRSELQKLQGNIDILTGKNAGLEESVRTMSLKSLTDEDINSMKVEITTLSDQTSKSTEAFLGVKSAVDQSTQSIETKISTLTAHVRASKDDVVAMRDEVTSMSEAVNRIKTQADVAKSTADDVNEKLANFKNDVMKRLEPAGKKSP